MAAHRQYASAGAFRTALEARLHERARRDGVDLHRLRRQVAFDRLLARMFDPSQPVRDESVEGEDWLGFAGIPAVVVPASLLSSTGRRSFTRIHAHARRRTAASGISWISF